MKIKSLFLAMAACVGLFCACTNDVVTDELTGNGSGSEKNAYASFSFVMPNSGAGTRAAGGPDGDGSVVGTDQENEFSTVGILLFEKETDAKYTLTQVEYLDRAAFSPKLVGGATQYSTIEDIAVTAATYRVYVILNPSEAFKTTYPINATSDRPSYSDFMDSVEKAGQGIGGYCTDGKFMMTNARTITETVVAEFNVAGNAKSVEVLVERIAAKITFSSIKENGENSYAIKDADGNKIGSVVFDAYKVINTKSTAYNLRRVNVIGNLSSLSYGGAEIWASGGTEENSNYVIENGFNEKKLPFKDNKTWFEANYSRRYDTYIAFRALNKNADLQTLAYCLENTMPKDKQINGYSTGVIFRAKATLTNVEGTNGDFYKYGGKLYASLEAMIKAYNPKWNASTPLENLSVDILGFKENEVTKGGLNSYLSKINNPTTLHNSFAVDYYVQGFCYYTTWIRHADNGVADMGVMEFAIVRNNVYRMTINSVAALGSFTSGTPGKPNPEEPEIDSPKGPGTNPEIPGEPVKDPEPSKPSIDIDPETPDEKYDTYLNVTIKVLDWTIRDNGVEL